MSNNHARLGKGLEALIPRTYFTSGKTITSIPIAEIKMSPFQPRMHFKDDSIENLVESIKKWGVVQPVIVRRKNDFYELVAGERRYRASIAAGQNSIPAIIKNITDQESLQLALVENLMREDLNPIEEARGFYRLINEFNLTHQEVAEIFGKNRSTITNLLRLLTLPDSIKEALIKKELSEGHARALLTLSQREEDMLALVEEIKKNNLTVREIEELSGSTETEKKKHSKKQTVNKFIKEKEAGLLELSKLILKIRGNEDKGQVIIKYKSKDEFNQIYQLLSSKFQN